MSRLLTTISAVAFLLFTLGAAVFLQGGYATAQNSNAERITRGKPIPYSSFDIEVLVNGRPLTEYYARGKTYVEALQGAEYELRLRNSSPDRVAVALSVDGLNTIDARHTSAWNASKWIIEPHQTITISGWQMSSERARHFYFTTERDSYAAKLGQTKNIGVISAVFYRERIRLIPVTPPYQTQRGDRRSEQSSTRQEAPSTKAPAGEAARDNRAVAPVWDDEYAATGIGRSVRHDVRWVDMALDSRPAAELTVRYEYYSALLRLGVIPRYAREQNPLQRREESRGFSPEP